MVQVIFGKVEYKANNQLAIVSGISKIIKVSSKVAKATAKAYSNRTGLNYIIPADFEKSGGIVMYK